MMRRVLSLVVRAMVVALFLAGCTADESSRPVSRVHDPRDGKLQQIVNSLQQETSIPGLSVALARTGEQPVVATAGLADRERGIAVTPDTMFFTGSVSKNLFATVALRFLDQGRLTLDTPLSTCVDWPRGDEITLEMLLSHTSGIPDYLTEDRYAPADDGGIPLFFRKPHTPVEIFELLPDREPRFKPGSTQDYSNTNGLLVGEMIRHAAGQPLGKVFDEEIVSLLGLEHMYLYGAITASRERARGYCQGEIWGADEGELVDCSAADDALPDSADGSVVSSPSDLLLYHQALRGGKLLSDESWTAMRGAARGFHNGLGYLVGDGPFGRYEGNVGRAMGHVAASVYYVDHDTYVVIMSNFGNAPLPLRSFLEKWFDEVEQPRD